MKMTTNPWMDGILPIRFIELVSVGLNASSTNLNPRRRINNAFKAGRTVEEIMEVLKLGVVQGVQA